MKKTKKILLIIGISLISAGIIIAIISALAVGFDRESLGLDTAKTNNYVYTEEVKSIDIESAQSDIYISKSEDNSVKIEIFESTRLLHNVSLANSNLTISLKNKTVNLSGISNLKREIHLAIPENDYAKLKVKNVSGKVSVIGHSINNLDFDLVSSDLELKNIKGSNGNIKTVSGNIDLDNVLLNDSIIINTVSGDSNIANFDSKSISLESVSGSFNLQLRTNKNYDLKTVGGNITKPAAQAENGSCYIKTVSGDIIISLMK